MVVIFSQIEVHFLKWRGEAPHPLVTVQKHTPSNFATQKGHIAFIISKDENKNGASK